MAMYMDEKSIKIPSENQRVKIDALIFAEIFFTSSPITQKFFVINCNIIVIICDFIFRVDSQRIYSFKTISAVVDIIFRNNIEFVATSLCLAPTKFLSIGEIIRRISYTSSVFIKFIDNMVYVIHRRHIKPCVGISFIFCFAFKYSADKRVNFVFLTRNNSYG